MALLIIAAILAPAATAGYAEFDASAASARDVCHTASCRERVARKQCAQARPVPCVERAILRYQLRGWEASWMRRVPRCESGWNPYARNPSGASGLFQILYPSTWNTTPYRRRDPFSAKWNSLAAAYMVRQRRTREWVCK